MKLELFIALRYLKAKRKQAVISIVTIIAVLGVAAGVTALIVALSISAGFREDLQGKLLRGTSHINVLPVKTSDGISRPADLARKIRQVKGVRSALPAIYQTVLVSTGARQSVVMLKGLAVSDSTFLTDDFFQVKSGSIRNLAAPPGDPVRDRLAIGRDLAQQLGTFVGDFVTIISDEGTLSPLGMVPTPVKFQIAAVFDSGLFQFDSEWGFTSLESAQHLFGTGDLVSLIECRVHDIYHVRPICEEIRKVLGPEFVVQDWQELNRTTFEALKLEKLVMVITISLIVFVAALNIITTLVMMVMEKNRDIAVLMSMGTTRHQIRRIFITQGLIIGIVGACLGLVCGYAICWICDEYHLIRLQADVYSISYVPFRTSAWDGLVVALSAVAISFLATLYPSRSAASLDPVEALRYE
ncbi:MAG: FtsX-like permease family protein [Acidobacteriota bacterium]